MIVRPMARQIVMNTETQNSGEDNGSDRWTLIRDIAVLQVKLIFDGLRDFILVPVSLIAGIISLVRAGAPAGNEFYNLLRVGKRSEQWCDRFGAAERVPEPAEARVKFPEDDIDTLVGRVESFVVDEYRSGGLTKQAKDQLDQLLDSIQQRQKQDSEK